MFKPSSKPYGWPNSTFLYKYIFHHKYVAFAGIYFAPTKKVRERQKRDADHHAAKRSYVL